MRSHLRHIVAAVSLACTIAGTPLESSAQLVPNVGGQRVGISSFQFLKIGVGGRAVGMGESFVAVANDASALYWNPAGLVQFAENQVIASHTEYVVDIKHAYFGIVHHFTAQDAIGASFSSLYLKDMEITTETQPSGTGRYFAFGDIAIGLSYSRKMTDQFSFGATVKYVEETMDVLKMRSVMVDIGTWYWTGLGSTRFAVVISNFGADTSPKGTVKDFNGREVTTFQSFSLPTVFRLGIALDPILTDDHVLTTSLQLNHPNDNAEHLRLGIEYAYRQVFFLRMGVKRTINQELLGEDATSEENLTFGAGVRVPVGFTTVGADYAFADYNRLGSVHRISLQFTY